MDTPNEFEKQEPMSEMVASAWADVIISIHERTASKEATKHSETPLGPGVVAGHGSTGDYLTSELTEAS